MERLHERGNHRLCNVLRRAVLFLIALFVIVAIALINSGGALSSAVYPYTVSGIGEDEMRIHFLTVGQADCTVVEFADGRALLIDGGDGSFSANRHIQRYLKGLGSPTLTVVATHADLDHCGGLPYVLRTFGADTVYLPVLPGETGAYASLIEEAEKLGIEANTLTRYDVINGAGGAYALCLSPFSADETNGNDASAVLYVSYAGVNTLLCADISVEREEQLYSEYMLSACMFDVDEYTVRLDEIDVLKVAHHGSAGSSSQEWLNLLCAETAILSCGAGNSYGHPSPQAVKRLLSSGADLYRTDELGDIMVTISSDGAYKVEWGYI